MPPRAANARFDNPSPFNETELSYFGGEVQRADISPFVLADASSLIQTPTTKRPTDLIFTLFNPFGRISASANAVRHRFSSPQEDLEQEIAEIAEKNEPVFLCYLCYLL